jgi:hypothetical protein
MVIEEVDWLVDVVERCEGILDRRGTRGDFLATSTRTSLGLMSDWEVGLSELSDTSSFSVEVLVV